MRNGDGWFYKKKRRHFDDFESGSPRYNDIQAPSSAVLWRLAVAFGGSFGHDIDDLVWFGSDLDAERIQRNTRHLFSMAISPCPLQCAVKCSMGGTPEVVKMSLPRTTHVLSGCYRDLLQY